MDTSSIKRKFISIFNTEPLIFSAPGRINIIGEHTDYNGGLVMPAALDKAIYVAISKRDDDEIRLFSESYDVEFVTSTQSIKKSDVDWANYLIGVVDGFLNKGFKISGFNLYLCGDVPLGAGLSSSAAVECATAIALKHINDIEISKMDLALIAQKAEHDFAGVNCGIMDQFASVFGQKDHAVMLDCQTMAYEYIPLNLQGYKLVLLNTNVKHSLSDSAYNERRNQCEQGVKLVKDFYPKVQFLKDVNTQMLLAHVLPNSKEVFEKCSYVIDEIERVKKASLALKKGDLNTLGELMFETHEGLSKMYEVSCRELDFLIDNVKNIDGVLGARMMGGGFGGCTINIVKDEMITPLIESLSKSYTSAFGIDLSAYVVTTGDGARKLENN